MRLELDALTVSKPNFGPSEASDARRRGLCSFVAKLRCTVPSNQRSPNETLTRTQNQLRSSSLTAVTIGSHPQTSFSRIINLKANEVVRGWGFSSPLNLNLNLNFCPSSQNLERRNAESGREFVFCIFGPRAAVLADGKVRSP
jgi:hypothetical protein